MGVIFLTHVTHFRLTRIRILDKHTLDIYPGTGWAVHAADRSI